MIKYAIQRLSINTEMQRKSCWYEMLFQDVCKMLIALHRNIFSHLTLIQDDYSIWEIVLKTIEWKYILDKLQSKKTSYCNVLIVPQFNS